MVQILQTNRFFKSVKKLHPKQKSDLDEAVKTIMNDPDIGELKVGDLTGVRVYKFKMMNQLTLLAYTYEDSLMTLTLLAVSSHENFYRKLKR